MQVVKLLSGVMEQLQTLEYLLMDFSIRHKERGNEMKKYYKLSNGNTGEMLASYARPQLNVSELVYLEEPDDPLKTVWDGEFWDYNLNKYKKNTWKELFKYLQDNL